MTNTWSTITELKPYLQKAWEHSNFKEPTPIQRKAMPLILEGKDVAAESPTGTGKTLAYLLPVLQMVSSEQKEIQAVIMASSHELVMQIHQEFQKWSEGSELYGATFIGGANVKRQLEKLKKRPQVIIGTPGRIFELIKQKKIKMHTVKTIVLDEGDQLLVPEHLNTIKEIIKTTLKERQLILFSATLPEGAEQLAKDLMNEPEVVKIDRSEVHTGVKVEHVYIVSETRDKILNLERLSRLKGIRGLVFMGDIGNLSVAAEKLQYKGVPLGVLHSDANKKDRQTALEKFRTGEYPLLLATDVAARGLDIQGITHVIHFDLPKGTTEYTHRSGRTGRLGSDTTGTVISLVTEREERELKQYCRELKIPLAENELFKGELIEKRPKRTVVQRNNPKGTGVKTKKKKNNKEKRK